MKSGKEWLCTLALVLLCLATLATARNGGCKPVSQQDELVTKSYKPPDLPGFVAPSEFIPAGSLIIGMDSVTQPAASTGFNLEAYGAAIDLLYENIPLKWVIQTGKAKDGIDMTVETTSNTDPTPTVRDFRAGPFVVDAVYAGAAAALIPPGVAYYTTTEDTYGDVRHELTSKPFIAVSDADGNADIHTGYLMDAGVRADAYRTIDSTELALLDSAVCYSIVTEPHLDLSVNPATNAGYVDAAREFLASGGNMVAQCAAILVYETGSFLTSLGVLDGGSVSSFDYDNFDTPFAQFDGDVEDVGGTIQNALPIPLSQVIPGTFAVVYDDGILLDRYKMWARRVESSDDRLGGIMHYLGGHDYNPNSLEKANAVRTYLNAVMSPTTRPDNCALSFSTDVEVTVYDSGDPIVTGDEVTYTVVVENQGTTTLPDATAVLTLDEATAYVSGCGESGGVVTCSTGQIKPGERVLFDVTLRTTISGPIGVSVDAATSAGETFDLNNYDCERTLVCSASANAVLTKTVMSAPPSIEPASEIVFEIEVQNLEAFDLENVLIRDVARNGMILTASSHTDTTLLTPGIMELEVGTIAAMSTFTATVTAQVTETRPGVQLFNEACIADASVAIPRSLRCDTANVTLRTSLTVTKTAFDTSVRPGDEVVYEIVVVNEDTVQYTGVTIDDTPPSGLTIDLEELFLQTLAPLAQAEPFDDATVIVEVREVGESDGFGSGSVSVTNDPLGGQSLHLDDVNVGIVWRTGEAWESPPTFTFEYLLDGATDGLIISYRDYAGTFHFAQRIAPSDASDVMFQTLSIIPPDDFGSDLRILAQSDGWWIRNAEVSGTHWMSVAEAFTDPIASPLNPGDRFVLRLNATVTASPGELTNTALVTTTSPASATSASSTITVLPAVVLTARASRTRVYPGEQVTVIIEIENLDALAATATSVTDTTTPGAYSSLGSALGTASGICVPLGLSFPPTLFVGAGALVFGCKQRIEYFPTVDTAFCCGSIQHTVEMTRLIGPSQTASFEIDVLAPFLAEAFAEDAGGNAVTAVYSGNSFVLRVALTNLAGFDAAYSVSSTLDASFSTADPLTVTGTLAADAVDETVFSATVTHDGVSTVSPGVFAITVEYDGTAVAEFDFLIAVLQNSTRFFTMVAGRDLRVEPIAFADVLELDRTSVVVSEASFVGNNIIVNPSFGHLLYQERSGAGNDSFTFVVCAISPPTLCEQTVVNITVVEAVVAIDDSFTVHAGVVQQLDVLGNDAGPFNGTQLVLATGPGVPYSRSNASLVLVEPPLGYHTVEYKANASFTGADSFTYTVCSLGEVVAVEGCQEELNNCDTARVDLTVLPPPVDANVTQDVVYMPYRATTITFNVLLNDVVTAGYAYDATSLMLSAQPPEGTFVHVGNGVIEFTATSVPWYPGNATIMYTVCTLPPFVVCGSANVTVASTGPCELPIGRLITPNRRANVMMYQPIHVSWEFVNPYPGVLVDIVVRNGSLPSDMVVRTNIPASKTSLTFVPHHLLPSTSAGLYSVTVRTTLDGCFFRPPAVVDLYGSASAYCALPEEQQSVLCDEFRDNIQNPQ